MNLVCFTHAGALVDPFRALEPQLHRSIKRTTFIGAFTGRNHVKADLYLNYLFNSHADAFTGPTVFLGHSAGGHLALRAAALAPASTELRALFISSSTSLSCALSRRPRADDSDASLIDFLTRMGGTDSKLLHHSEARALILSTLRHDLTLMNSLEDPAPRSLDVPIHEFWGCDEPEALLAPFWSRISRRGHHLTRHNGGHFHLYNQLAELSCRVNGTFELPQPSGRELI